MDDHLIQTHSESCNQQQPRETNLVIHTRISIPLRTLSLRPLFDQLFGVFRNRKIQSMHANNVITPNHPLLFFYLLVSIDDVEEVRVVGRHGQCEN